MLKIFQYFTGNDRRQHAAAARCIRTAKSRRHSRKQYTSAKVPQDGDRACTIRVTGATDTAKSYIHTAGRRGGAVEADDADSEKSDRAPSCTHFTHSRIRPSRVCTTTPQAARLAVTCKAAAKNNYGRFKRRRQEMGRERCALRVVISHLHTRTDCLWFIHWDTAPGATPSVFAMSFCK